MESRLLTQSRAPGFAAMLTDCSALHTLYDLVLECSGSNLTLSPVETSELCFSNAPLPVPSQSQQNRGTNMKLVAVSLLRNYGQHVWST